LVCNGGSTAKTWERVTDTTKERKLKSESEETGGTVMIWNGYTVKNQGHVADMGARERKERGSRRGSRRKQVSHEASWPSLEKKRLSKCWTVQPVLLQFWIVTCSSVNQNGVGKLRSDFGDSPRCPPHVHNLLAPHEVVRKRIS